jgi:hypothetical protein
MALSQEQKDLLFGTLLGDGNLSTESTTTNANWRYRASHKKSHKEYLDHKYKVLGNLCGTPPNFGRTYDPRTEKWYQRWSFNTLTQDELRFYGNLFYKYDPIQQKWVKEVPTSVSSHLTDRALAYLYMDDGSLKWKNHSNAMRISTQGFQQECTQRLKNAIEKKYQIELGLTPRTLKSGRIGYLITIPEDSSAAFCSIIKPYLINCMKYKVPDGKRGNL